MNIDERLEFLVQSTESLHASCQQLHASIALHSRQIDALTQRSEEHAELLRILTSIARDHGDRLDDVENE